MALSRISQLLLQEVGTKAKTAGWIRSVRHHKSFSFLDLDDGSQSVQVIVDGDQAAHLVTGGSVEVLGTIKQGPKFKEIHCEELQVLGVSDGNYPLAKKAHTMEHLRSFPQFRARTKTISAALKVRSDTSMFIHDFFRARDFYFVHTPIITANDCEGAGEMFELKNSDFFGKHAYLTVSGQLQAEIFACSMGKVYTFGPAFRAEKSHTQRHLAEFWMVEPEMINYTLEETICLAKDLMKFTAQKILEARPEEIKFLNKTTSHLEKLIAQEWANISFQEAKKLTGGETSEPLSTEEERHLTSHYSSPVFVREFPASVTPFYMKKQGSTTKNFDLLLPEVGEVVGGSQREDSLEVLQKSMEGLHGLEWYEDLRRYGSMPHSGFGLGLERWLLFITGLSNVRDVVPVPRWHKNLLC